MWLYFYASKIKHMYKLIILLLAILTTLSLHAQQPNKAIANKLSQRDLVGIWALVSVDNIYPDSTRVHPYGEGPKGLLVFDEQGRYAIQILKAVRPKVVSGDKNKCTPEEYVALVQGSNAHFGQYTVDQAANTITFHIEHASFPNWEGTQQQRSCTYTGRELKYVVTQTTQGGVSVVAEVAWRRL